MKKKQKFTFEGKGNKAVKANQRVYEHEVKEKRVLCNIFHLNSCKRTVILFHFCMSRAEFCTASTTVLQEEFPLQFGDSMPSSGKQTPLSTIWKSMLYPTC